MSTTISVFRLIWSAGWEGVVAVGFIVTWIAPEVLGERMVHKMMFLMLVEFLVVHSTGFLRALSGNDSFEIIRRRPGLSKGVLLAGLLGFYTVFALAFSASYEGLWPFWAFALVTLPKLPSVIFEPVAADPQFVLMAEWALMTALYVIGALATTILPVPALGITESVIAAQGFTMTGIWPEEPYRVIAFGAFYFGGLALYSVFMEIRAIRRLARQSAA